MKRQVILHAYSGDPQSTEIANTIYHQIGGACLGLMCGIYDIYQIENGLEFRIGANKTSANRISIKLEWNDTYTMTFSRVRRVNPIKYATREAFVKASTPTVMKVYNNVYNDQLASIFTEYTGLVLTPPRIIMA